MKNKKRLIALGLAATMVAGMVTACGGDNGGSSNGGGSSEGTEQGSGTEGSDGGSSSGGGELQVNIWDNYQLDGLQAIADAWTEESGIKVNINVVTWDSYWTLLSSGAQGGEMPDVFWMHSNMAQMYMENNLLLNLDDYIAKDDKIDMANYYEGIVNLYNSNGSQYAIPKDHDTIALLYNEALFKKYNVDTPTDDWTWEDVYEAAKKITEAGKADGVYGYGVNVSNNQDGWYNILEDYGAQVITDDNRFRRR